MDIKLDTEYYWTRSEGEWIWDGKKRWWEIFVIITGWNGAGGAWIREIWRWNNSKENIREEVRSLSYGDTVKLIKDINENQKISGE